jgi:hypothetical protein
MKRNISDLLDSVPVDDVDLSEKTPLSARRIKAKTLSQIGKKNPTTIRWLPRVALIAAVIMLMTVSVFAADGIFNDGAIFDYFFGEDISESQIALMDDLGKAFGDTVTSNGASITAISGVADENTYYIHLRVVAREGTVLPDLSDEQQYCFRSKEGGGGVQVEYLWDNDSLRQDTWYPIYADCYASALHDDDPTDNVKEFIIRLTRNSETSAAFNSSRQIRLTIRSMYIHNLLDHGQQMLFTGSFTFDISNFNEHRENQTITVWTGDLRFYNEEYDYYTTVRKVTISPLRIDVECSHTTSNNKYIFPRGGPIQIVMKDGSIVDALEAYYDAQSQRYPHPDSVVGAVPEGYFDVPIVVEDIDYLIIGGEHIVDVN